MSDPSSNPTLEEDKPRKKSRTSLSRGAKDKAIVEMAPTVEEQLKSAKASANGHAFHSGLHEFKENCFFKCLTIALFPWALIFNWEAVMNAFYGSIRTYVTGVGQPISKDWISVLNDVVSLGRSTWRLWRWENAWKLSHPQYFPLSSPDHVPAKAVEHSKDDDFILNIARECAHHAPSNQAHQYRLTLDRLMDQMIQDGANRGVVVTHEEARSWVMGHLFVEAVHEKMGTARPPFNGSP